MRTRILALSAVPLFACAAPRPLDLRELDEADRRFAPVVRADGKATVEEVLRKEALTLEDVLAVADLLNPLLASERKQIDLATAAVWEARLYPNPSLVLEVEDYRTRDGATIGRAERTAGVRVPLVVGGRIGAATGVAEKEREVAALRYLWRRREILTDVKRAFTAVLASERRVGLVRETRDIAKAFHDLANDRYQAQVIPEMEVLKAAVSLAKAESDLRFAERDLGLSVKALQGLLGDVDFPKDRFRGDLPERFVTPSLEAVRGHLVAAHPSLEAARKDKETADLAVSLAKAEAFPDLAIRVSAGRGAEDESIVEGGIEMPLPVFNRNQAKIAAARTRLEQAALQVQSVGNDLALRLTEAYRNFTAAQERVATYRAEILPKAQQALDQTDEGYRQGKFGLLDVLDAQRTLADARLTFAAALTDLNLAAADLEKLTGTPLEPIP